MSQPASAITMATVTFSRSGQWKLTNRVGTCFKSVHTKALTRQIRIIIASPLPDVSLFHFSARAAGLGTPWQRIATGSLHDAIAFCAPLPKLAVILSRESKTNRLHRYGLLSS